MGRKAGPSPHEITDLGGDLLASPLSRASRTQSATPKAGEVPHPHPHTVQHRRQDKADFHFCMKSWQPSRSCLLTAERLKGTIRLFPVVCCVAIPPLAEPPRDF